MKSIVFFNNKGGVGKTTLACNLVSYMNKHKNIRVLLIDADPQCNATQAILSDEICENIYLEPDENSPKTLYSYLAPLEMGEPQIELPATPILGTTNRFQTDLIPGHPSMSIIEDRLSDAWSMVRGREVGGYRITNWCHQLLSSLNNQYDLVVFDVGPSLGALNRSIILSCDYIVTPFGCDIFSLLGIKNIADWITKWDEQYMSSVKDGVRDHPQAFDKYKIIDDTSQKHRFLGYSVQQYVSRKFKTGHRPVKSYDEIMHRIPGTVEASMKSFLPENLDLNHIELGHIPYLYSLVPMAQAAKAPMHSLVSTDGVIGNQYKQVIEFQELMSIVSDKILGNLELL
ncbi:ParA family protein [Acinetobacter baumannii]|uniref:ParA family protein n=1 Tax=Acinetobacter baumannii TaxID=470 RepID=UPI0011298DAF|nr:AAA family ATPase [Acinetobacter baumannii]TPS23180.1 ParA family protein [Acinetobacter baumannii]